jgi:general bacterial porin, GBP family
MIRHQSIQNSIRHESPTYCGFTVGTMYGFSNETGEFSNGRAYSRVAKYDNGPVSLAASYLRVNRSAGAANVNTGGAITNGDSDAVIAGGSQQIWGSRWKIRLWSSITWTGLDAFVDERCDQRLSRR